MRFAMPRWGMSGSHRASSGRPSAAEGLAPSAPVPARPAHRPADVRAAAGRCAHALRVLPLVDALASKVVKRSLFTQPPHRRRRRARHGSRSRVAPRPARDGRPARSTTTLRQQALAQLLLLSKSGAAIDGVVGQLSFPVSAGENDLQHLMQLQETANLYRGRLCLWFDNDHQHPLGVNSAMLDLEGAGTADFAKLPAVA